MEDCVKRVGAASFVASFVSKLDLLKSYWQVVLTPREAEISAFMTAEFNAVHFDGLWVVEHFNTL